MEAKTGEKGKKQENTHRLSSSVCDSEDAVLRFEV